MLFSMDNLAEAVALKKAYSCCPSNKVSKALMLGMGHDELLPCPGWNFNNHSHCEFRCAYLIDIFNQMHNVPYKYLLPVVIIENKYSDI